MFSTKTAFRSTSKPKLTNPDFQYTALCPTANSKLASLTPSICSISKLSRKSLNFSWKRFSRLRRIFLVVQRRIANTLFYLMRTTSRITSSWDARCARNITVLTVGLCITTEWHAKSTKSTKKLTRMMMCFWTLRKEWTLNSVISANSGYKKTEDAVIWLADVERHFKWGLNSTCLASLCCKEIYLAFDAAIID